MQNHTFQNSGWNDCQKSEKTSVFPVVRSLFGGGMPQYIELAYAKGCKRNHLMWEISHSPHITKNHFVVLQCLATCQSLPCELLIPKAGSVATSATAIASESWEVALAHCLNIASDVDVIPRRTSIVFFGHCDGTTRGSQKWPVPKKLQHPQSTSS